MVFNRRKKNIEVKDSGFGTDVKNEGARLLNRDGSSNVRKEGLGFFQRFSLFHTLINMNWLTFFGCLFLGFLAANLVFATAYWIIGVDGINGSEEMGSSHDFWKAFFFSTQTITTVGYGALSPANSAISIVAAMESFIGLLGFAIATGLLYGKFSRARARLIFSENALVSPYNEIKGIMVRLANSKASQIINVEASMIFAYREEDKAGTVRKFYALPLELSRINTLATSWTLVHPLDEESPLKDLTPDDMLKSDAELIIQIDGFDVTYNQPVNTRRSYKAEDFVWNAKFIRILGNDSSGTSTVRLDKLSDYELR